jgi:hypothetical protein
MIFFPLPFVVLGNWTEGLLLARQVFYHLNHTPTPFAIVLTQGPVNFAQACLEPVIHLSVSWARITGMHGHALLIFCFIVLKCLLGSFLKLPSFKFSFSLMIFFFKSTWIYFFRHYLKFLYLEALHLFLLSFAIIVPFNVISTYQNLNHYNRISETESIRFSRAL